MAKIPLRSYFREIESLVERGMNEEAAAHCRFILKYYPKSIDTYRLLCKAFLESQRYSEAADILQRVLSVVPDDFFALIGMSITREDEGNLDAAIFYMERAYESQPANVAVQDELRRLYGRRDGVEPPKLRLSRGALVRMYHKGGLNRQAIAEINVALKEDPQRTDLELILAKIHMDLGEKIPAFEVASRILAKLPFCYDAIQILVNILPTTAHAEDTQKYVERLISLDPYIAFISSSCPTVQQVPDNAVIIDRLDWQASHAEVQQPVWAQNAGVSLEAESSDSSPDWLADVSASTATPVETIQSVEEKQASDPVIPAVQPAENNIPDWMQQAGWTTSDGVADESQPAFEPTEDEDSASEPARAELPDWLRELAPDDAGISEEGTPEDQEKIDLLEQILPPALATAGELPPADEVLPSENSEIPVTPTESIELPQETLDFLAGLSSLDQEETFNEAKTNTGETTTQLPSEEEIPQASLPVSPEQANEETIPDWIANLTTIQTEDIQSETVSEITPGLGQTELDQIADSESMTTETISEEPLPDWLKEIAASQEIASSVDEVVLPTPPIDIDSRALVQAATVENEMAIEPEPVNAEVQSEGTAELSELENLEDIVSIPEPIVNQPEGEATQPVIEELASEIVSEIEPSAPIADTTPAQNESPLPDFSDADAALAWLESLAAKQGAAEETLITPPEERLEIAPDWIQALASSEEGEQPVSEENAGSEKEPEQSIPDETSVEEIQVEIPTPVIPTSELIELPIDEKPSEPEVVATLPEQVSIETAQQPQPPADMDFDTAFAWLESLAAQQGASEETLITPVEERPTISPDFSGLDIEEEEAASPTQPIKITAAVPTEVVEPLTMETTPEEVPAPVSSIEQPAVEPSTSEEIALESEGKSVEVLGASEETAIPALSEEPKHTGQLAPLPDWLQGISSEPAQEPTKAQEPPATDLPDWLKGLESVVESQPQAQSATEPLPEWLSDIEKAPAEPPAEEPQTDAENAPEWVQGLAESEESKAVETAGTLTQEDLQKFDELEAIPAGTETPQLLLNAAQSAAASGKIEISMRYYTRLIQNRVMIEETIHDLRDALYRYPVDISIWQTLGDAYLRNNQIQDALDAYTKAEEFLR